jgi:hypothetical protein
MTNLVYWYGAYENVEGAYSFLPTNKLIPFDAGKKRVEKKLESLRKKKRLSKTDELLQKGILEMEEDMKIEPSLRSGNLDRDFLEVYEQAIEEGEVHVPSPLPEAVPSMEEIKKKNKKSAKRKLSDIDTSLTSHDAKVIKVKKEDVDN